MSTVVVDRIARELALLQAAAPKAADALGFGRDLSCVLDITADCAEVDPASVVGVGQAVIRRLITPRGQLPGDANYGMDVRGYCSHGVTVQTLRELEGLVRLEIGKDERIEDATVSVTTPTPGALTFAVQLKPADPALTPFELTFAVTSGALAVERLG